MEGIEAFLWRWYVSLLSAGILWSSCGSSFQLLFRSRLAGPFLTLQVRVREAIRTESQKSGHMTIYWAAGSMSFSSCSYYLFMMLMHLLIWSFQKPKGLLPRNWWNKKKKQLTHLTPIILPIIFGFHLLPSVFAIYTHPRFENFIKTLRAASFTQLNFGDLRLHGFESTLHTPNLCLEGHQQGIMSFIQQFRDWLTSWKKIFQVAKELEPLSL